MDNINRRGKLLEVIREEIVSNCRINSRQMDRSRVWKTGPGRPRKKSAVEKENAADTSFSKKNIQSPAPKSYYPIDTKGLCILCYRESINKNFPTSKKDKIQLSVRFCTSILRYLKLNVQKHIIQQSKCAFPKLRKYKKVSAVLCEDCSLLARSFCALYSQMESLQMRIDTCVKNVSEIVRLAGRIPARLKVYQDRMGLQQQSSQVPSFNVTPISTTTQQVAITRANSTTVAVKGIHNKGLQPNRRPSVILAQNFRTEIVRKSTERRRTCLPRVSLKKCDTNDAETVVQDEVIASNSNNKNDLSHTPKPNTTSNVGEGERSSPIEVDEEPTHSSQTPSPCQSPDLFTPVTLTKPRVILPLSTPTTAADVEVIAIQEPDTPITNPDAGTSTSASRPIRRDAITITDSGKTVMLPHQTFKIDNAFVDESAMDYDEPNYDMIDISDDMFLSSATGVATEANPLNYHPPNIDPFSTSSAEIQIKQEQDSDSINPQDGFIDLNDRTCKECRITLSCRAELEKHRAFIHKLRCYVQCPVCKEMFASYNILKNLHRHHSQCAIGEEDEIRELEFVAKSVFPFANNGNGNKFCPMEGCFEVFCSEDSLKLHLKAHGSWPCKFCKDKREFDKAHELALHESEEHSGIASSSTEGFKCSRCPFHVGSQYSYFLHFLDAHLNINPFKERCEICQKGFVTSFDIKAKKAQHFQTHHEIKEKDPKSINICDLCQAPFLKKNQLIEHSVQIHHLETSKKHKCGICGTELLSAVMLTKHKMIVHYNASVHEVEAEIKRKSRSRNKKKKGMPVPVVEPADLNGEQNDDTEDGANCSGEGQQIECDIEINGETESEPQSDRSNNLL